MKKILHLFVFIILLVGCSMNQVAPKENEFLLSEVNDMADAEIMVFNSYEASGELDTFNLYEDDEEMVTIINKIKNMKVTEDHSDIDLFGEGEQPNSYLLVISHNDSSEIYTTLSVNDKGTVYIWNRYTNGEKPTMYVSEGNQGFYDQVAQIVEEKRERERNLNAKDEEEIDFEYKAETSEQASIFEVRSEDGKLIADLSDIEQNSVKAETNKSGHPMLKLRFKDKEFVSLFTRAHVGEEIKLYVDGKLVASPMIMQVVMSKELTLSGAFDKTILDEIVKTIKEADQ